MTSRVLHFRRPKVESKLDPPFTIEVKVDPEKCAIAITVKPPKP
jgi:hypothetical protein